MKYGEVDNVAPAPSATSSALSVQSARRIVLIDGTQLARLMLSNNIGCRDEEILHLKKVDEDFFDSE